MFDVCMLCVSRQCSKPCYGGIVGNKVIIGFFIAQSCCLPLSDYLICFCNELRFLLQVCFWACSLMPTPPKDNVHNWAASYYVQYLKGASGRLAV